MHTRKHTHTHTHTCTAQHNTYHEIKACTHMCTAQHSTAQYGPQHQRTLTFTAQTLRAFAPSSSEFIPFLACHHSITDFEINAFLNQDS